MSEHEEGEGKIGAKFKLCGVGKVTYPDGTVVPFEQEFLTTLSEEQLQKLGIKRKEIPDGNP